MDGLDLDINNYTMVDLENFFQIESRRKYTASDIELKETQIRELLLSTGHIDKKFKSDLLVFLETAKKWLIAAKCTPMIPAPPQVHAETRTQELTKRE